MEARKAVSTKRNLRTVAAAVAWEQKQPRSPYNAALPRPHDVVGLSYPAYAVCDWELPTVPVKLKSGFISQHPAHYNTFSRRHGLIRKYHASPAGHASVIGPPKYGFGYLEYTVGHC